MTALPIRRLDDRVTLHVLGEHDAPWIAAILDEVESSIGLPSRELTDRLARLDLRTSPARRAAVVRGLRGWLGRHNGRGGLASKVRQHVLGAPALRPGEREARIASASLALELTPAQLETALWSDLPSERELTLPRGRPEPLAVAAAANLDILKAALRRAHRVRITLWGNARPVFRTASLQGLLATAGTAPSGESVLEVSGPLALFHRTTVYGNALGALIGSLAWCERFVLEMHCQLASGPALIRIGSPMLLPPALAARRYNSALEARFARDFARAAPPWRAVREPAALAAGEHLVFPDFVLEHRDEPERRWWLEIVGFWTADYLAHKLARYRAAALDRVILCIDGQRAVTDDELPRDARIVRFERRIPVESVVAIIAGSR